LRKRTSNKRIPTILLTLLLLAVACNYPGFGGGQGEISAGELRATLQAHSFILTQVAAALPTPASPGIPATPSGSKPGLPGTLIPDAPGPAPTTQPGAPIIPPAAPPTPTAGALPLAFTYLSQPGDTLAAVALRFAVDPAEIISNQPIDPTGYLPQSSLLGIPNRLENLESAAWLLPDSEIVYSPSAAGFDITGTIQSAGGYLSRYTENIAGESHTGAEIVQRVATEASINPRLLLAILQYQSGWLLGEPLNNDERIYPVGFGVPDRTGLYEELVMAASHLGIGYYGWRAGSLPEIRFADKTTARLSPEINAGTAALHLLFARINNRPAWAEAMFGPQSLPALHAALFGDPWARSAAYGPLLPDGLRLEFLELPFMPGERWGFTGGPHLSWLSGSPRGAIDFSPVTDEAECAVSRTWATAAAPGVITRAARNVVVLDIDGDGSEQTGWAITYLHIAAKDMIPAGSIVAQDAQLGHPSCEGGQATGKHIHIARKYNGEWIAAGGPAPFVLSGWQIIAGERPYQGQLVKGDQVVTANSSGPSSSVLVR